MLDPQHLPVPELHLRSLIRDPNIWDKKRVQKLASKVSFSMGSHGLFHGTWMKSIEIPLKSRLQTPRICKKSQLSVSSPGLWSLGPAPFGFQLRKQNWIPANFELPGACTANRWRGKPQHLQLQRQVKSWTFFDQYYDTHMVMISKWKNMLTYVNILYETHLVSYSYYIILWWYQYEHHLNG